MEKIYLDNAATTPVLEEVLTRMIDSMRRIVGNPSSTHQFGRTAKAMIETARKNIAKKINVSASEIIFTSGGTEADNLIVTNAVSNMGVTHIITSKIEHHAVLKTVMQLEAKKAIEVSFVEVDENGTVDLVHLRKLLGGTTKKTLVSLLFVNNEIGTVLDCKKVATICKEYGAFFHSDAVQAVGHFPIDLQETSIDFIAASAHKFHGPKGIGFAYFKKGFGIEPMIYGGEQEKGARAGTEAVHAILGMETALTIALQNLDTDFKKLQTIKQYFIEKLQQDIPSIAFNGGSDNLEQTTPTILSVRLPVEAPFLLFNLDLKGIAVSGGSACQSGSNKGSHVLREVLNEEDENKTSIRFSFSKFTTTEEIDTTVTVLSDLLSKVIS